MLPKSLNKRKIPVKEEQIDVGENLMGENLMGENLMGENLDAEMKVLNNEIDNFLDEYKNIDKEAFLMNDDEEEDEQDYNDFYPDSYNDAYERDDKLSHISKSSEKGYVFESLDTDLDGYLNQPFSSIPNIHICSYYINTKGKLPFLQYFLYKEKRENDENNESFAFPTFKYNPRSNVILQVISIMDALCISYYKGSHYAYKGFKRYNNDIYIFFDCSQLDIEYVRLDKNNDLWLVLIDEIINKGYVCNYKIEESVKDFFYNNSEVVLLRDLERNIYETPTIVYASCSEKRLRFCSVFGISSLGDETSLFGNYYYFTDYRNVFHESEKKQETGIIRLAIFLGKTKIVRNLPDDPIDESEITQYLITTSGEKYEIDRLIELKAQLRISDRDGLWTKEYDSIFMGKVELNNGNTTNPLWVTKEYDQQIVISSHLVDKKKREIGINVKEEKYCIR